MSDTINKDHGHHEDGFILIEDEIKENDRIFKQSSYDEFEIKELYGSGNQTLVITKPTNDNVIHLRIERRTAKTLRTMYFTVDRGDLIYVLREFGFDIR